jgi:predicted ABC-type exoprotein transport system permease subunit
VAFSAADEVPLWIYLLLALAIALLGAAAFLPRTELAGFPARLVLGVVGVAILVGFTIAELL